MFNIGDKVMLDNHQAEVRGIQDLEPPVSYLLKLEDGSAHWVAAERVTPVTE